MINLAYILIIIASSLFCWYGVTLFLQKWDESQKRKAEETASQFEEMFVFLQRRTLMWLYIIIPLILGIIFLVTTQRWWYGLTAVIVGFFLPLWLVKIMDKTRRRRFVYQLVDALMILNSCLKGGLTLVQSFEILADEIAKPMSQEIALLNREIKVGVTLEEALGRLNKRMPSEEMLLVTSAILVARETGGDLTRVFLRLIDTIRDRLKLKELVTTLTLQARLQALIISLLGPAFFFLVRRFRPDHFDVMWQDEVGRIILLIAIFLQVLGVVLVIVFGKVEV